MFECDVIDCCVYMVDLLFIVVNVMFDVLMDDVVYMVLCFGKIFV